jgi:hypothetical protein
MVSQLKVNEIIKQSGSSISIGESGDTINVSGSALTQGITNAEQHHQTANITISSADTWTLLTPFTRSSGSGLGNIETYVSSSSGIFSFSQTGYYSIEFIGYLKRSNHLNQYAGTSIWMTTNDSSYTELSESYTNLQDTSNAYGNTSNKVIVDITDTSQCKVKFMAQTSDASGLSMQGGSSLPIKNYATFIRIGDT